MVCRGTSNYFEKQEIDSEYLTYSSSSSIPLIVPNALSVILSLSPNVCPPSVDTLA
jgi:hypothetical protein